MTRPSGDRGQSAILQNSADAIPASAYLSEMVSNSDTMDYRTLVVGWGSTYHAICEALGRLGWGDTSFLHFKQVYPLHDTTLEHLERADRVVVIESNATAQFARHIKFATGFEIDHRILKYDGRPFSVEEIVFEFKKIIA